VAPREGIGIDRGTLVSAPVNVAAEPLRRPLPDALRAAMPRFGVVAYLAVAATGLVVLMSAGTTLSATLDRIVRDPWEIAATWRVDWALVHGASVHAAYGGVRWDNSYPLPYELAFAPLGFLPAPAVALLARVLSLGLLLVAMAAWEPRPGSSRWSLVPILVSLPAAQLLVSDHVMSALGLAGLSCALLAQRRERWALAGVALAAGLVRPFNAAPVVAILALATWRRPRAALTLALACAATLAPLVLASYAVDARWVDDYRGNLSAYPMAGPTRLAVASAGLPGLVALVAVVVLLAAWIARPQNGSTGPDRASLALSLSVVAAPIEGFYPGVFALPALLRVGQRPAYWIVPWLASALAWAALPAALPALFGPAWLSAFSVLSATDLWLVVNSYPLLRRQQA
jgi:hypothetical protein